jgi:hypothetical protein
LTHHGHVAHYLEVCSADEEHIGTGVGIWRLILQREVVDRVALLAGLGIDALLLMIDDVTVNDEYASLTVIMLICLCDFEFFIHEGELGNLINTSLGTAPRRRRYVLRHCSLRAFDTHHVQLEVSLFALFSYLISYLISLLLFLSFGSFNKICSYDRSLKFASRLFSFVLIKSQQLIGLYQVFHWEVSRSE